MQIGDIIIILFILLGAWIGFRDGFTKSLVNCVGITLIIIIAYIFKNPVGAFLMNTGPFFDFWGLIKGVTALNIVLYESLAFSLIFSILYLVLKILSITTGIFEKILGLIVVLGFPSKILGAIVGALKNYILVFFALYILSMPMFATIPIVRDCKYREPILTKTPLLSNVADKTVMVFNDFASLKDKYEDSENSNQFNLETIDLFLKYNVVDAETVKNLVDSGKLHIQGIDTVLNKYYDRNEDE